MKKHVMGMYCLTKTGENVKSNCQKVKWGQFLTESEKFTEIEGNLKQREMHHCLRGWTPLPISANYTFPYFRKIYVFYLNLRFLLPMVNMMHLCVRILPFKLRAKCL